MIERLDGRSAEQTGQLETRFRDFLDSEHTFLPFANYARYLADCAQVPERELKNVDVFERIADEPELSQHRH